MNCLYCNIQNQDDTGLCVQCGRQLPNYSPPEGFEFNRERGLYYRPHGEQRILLFDPIGGQYAVEDVSDSDGKGVPEGFVYNPVSGLFYRLDDHGIVGGNYVCYMTWYDPVAQEYAQVEYSTPKL
jgi:hypothetical protein